MPLSVTFLFVCGFVASWGLQEYIIKRKLCCALALFFAELFHFSLLGEQNGIFRFLLGEQNGAPCWEPKITKKNKLPVYGFEIPQKNEPVARRGSDTGIPYGIFIGKKGNQQ